MCYCFKALRRSETLVTLLMVAVHNSDIGRGDAILCALVPVVDAFKKKCFHLDKLINFTSV